MQHTVGALGWGPRLMGLCILSSQPSNQEVLGEGRGAHSVIDSNVPVPLPGICTQTCKDTTIIEKEKEKIYVMIKPTVCIM